MLVGTQLLRTVELSLLAVKIVSEMTCNV